MTPGIAAAPSMSRQLPVDASSEFTRYARSWPTTIISVLSETSLPRTAAGTISAMYIGVTIDTAPTATPSNVRAAASEPIPPASAHQSEPMTKIRPAMINVRRRPSASATAPPVTAPSAAPTSNMEVTKPSWEGAISNSGVM